MFTLYMAFFVLVKPSDSFLTCDEIQCPSLWLGDHICDYACNTVPCNFDSITYSPDLLTSFTDSDCYYNCISTDFNKDLLGNGICDPDCNRIECAWDLGDCGYCSDGCTEELLTNEKCDLICQNLPCMYDNDQCGWCALDCFQSDLSSSTCIDSCNVSDCQDYDNNPCFTECIEGCKPSW